MRRKLFCGTASEASGGGAKRSKFAVRIFVKKSSDFVQQTPPIAGTWAKGGSANVLLFQPSKELHEGTHYTVSLKTDEGSLSKDFYIDEDPRILSIFPRADSETTEYSEITVVFSRPMVLLTTLSDLETRTIPVEITPATKGKWKWITTRNLQFIPESRLQRSASYTVTVKNGLVSADGLPVAGAKHAFTTRPLRYEGALAGNYSSQGGATPQRRANAASFQPAGRPRADEVCDFCPDGYECAGSLHRRVRDAHADRRERKDQDV